MCQDTTECFEGICARRELRWAGGRIVQCLGCGSIGVEFGTSYLVFSERDFFAFARWFATVRWEDEQIERGKLHIRVREETSLMLSLAREEVRSVGQLLAEGMRWVAESGATSKGSPGPTLSLGGTVH